MDILDLSCNDRLRELLVGRRLRRDSAVTAHRDGPMLAFWGADLGFSSGDVHHSRAYRIYLDLDGGMTIRDIRVVVEGELISPCSGYYPEALDRFDFPAVRDYCLRQTEGAISPGYRP